MTDLSSSGQSAGVASAAPPYTITLGATRQTLLAPLVPPAATVSGTGQSATLQGTTGSDVFDPGPNGGGTVVMAGNGGNDVFIVHGADDVVTAKPGGIDTVITDYGWGHYTLPVNVVNLIYDGPASYAHGWITLAGNALNDTIVANNHGVALMAGTGSDTLVGGTGADTFIIAYVIGGGGDDTILNFHGGAASDSVQLRSLGFSSFASVLAAMQQVGADTVLSLSKTRTVTFAGQAVASFTAAEFGFAAASSAPPPLAAAAPTLRLSATSGSAGAPVVLGIAAALVHGSAGESLTVTVAGVPAQATLSAGHRNSDGSWSLTAVQLAGLTLTTAAAATLNLTVTAVAADTNGSTAMASGVLQVTVAAPAYGITLGSTRQNLLVPLVLPAATISSTGWSPSLQGTAGNDVFNPGINSGGTATMIGGGGNDVFFVHGANDVVMAKAGGINTVITDYGWGSYTLPANVVNLIYDGAASYADGWITLVGNGLNDTIVGNNNGLTLVAGAGIDRLVGGTGADTFVIGDGGNDTIINFHGGAASDSVQLGSLGFSSFASVLAAMRQVGANAVLSLSATRTLTFVGQSVGSFTAAEFGFSAEPPVTAPAIMTGTASNGGGTAVTAPIITQPTQAGQLVGFLLRNNGTAAIGAHEIVFGQTFAAGQVPGGDQLFATVDGETVAVQLDVKTTYPDGSAAFAVLTLLQPALAAGASASAVLSLAAAPTAPAPISLSSLNTSGYDLTVSLTLHNADGSLTAYALNAGALLQQALQAGTATTVLSGAQVTEVQFAVPVSGSLRVVFDVSLFADGSTATNVSFNNDIAQSPGGGTVTYDAKITQAGVVMLQQSAITEYQYQTWNQTVYSNGAPQAQVVHDIAALEQTGAVPNYDLTAAISPAVIAAEASQLGGPTYGILGSAGLTQYMPTTGGRADIGPQPLWNAVWLITQDPAAQAFALAQANAAGSVPWHFYDPNTGGDLTITGTPNLWLDPRATPGSGYTGLTQPVSDATGWTPDQAHQPDLSTVAYLLTGDQTYLDQLNAQASWAVAADWTVPRQGALGLVANGQDQVREQAWNLHAVDEAAYANPDGSAMKAYFSQLETNNWRWLVSQIPAWTTSEGQAYGFLPGVYGSGSIISPWQQDYFASTAVQAAEQGNQNALTFLKWESNFLVGRFLSASAGFSPQDGVAYNLTTADASGAPLQTWSAVEQASAAAGQTNGSGWSQSQGDYAQLALQTLAGIITVTGSTAAMQAYGWLLASGAPFLDVVAGTQFDIVPRLPDGQLLTANHVILSSDTGAATLQGSDNDQLIHAGGGDDTLIGGSGINLLFAGAGNDVLDGGPNADYLFGSSGAVTFAAGAGSNFMRAGTGAAIFALSAADAATDMIAGFKLGIDHLDIAGEGPSSAFVGQMLQSATQDSGGDAILHLSPSHSVTLQGIGVSHVTVALFN